MADLKSIANMQIGGRKQKYPTKTTINLLYREKNTGKTVFTLVVFGIFLVFLGIFTKYLVIDQIARENEAEAAYNEAENQLTELQQYNADYTSVQGDYSHYGTSMLNADELARQDRAKMMDVINSKVEVDSGIQSIAITGNQAVIEIEKTTLSEVSEAVAALEESPIVAYVSPSTAYTNDDDSGQQTVSSSGGTELQPVDNTITAEITINFKSPLGDTSSDDSKDSSRDLPNELEERKIAVETEGMDQ